MGAGRSDLLAPTASIVSPNSRLASHFFAAFEGQGEDLLGFPIKFGRGMDFVAAWKHALAGLASRQENRRQGGRGNR